MLIAVTADDIQAAYPTTIDSPLTRALQRQTGQKWLVYRGLMAVHMEDNRIRIRLPGEVFQRWLDYEATKEMLPFEFEFNVHSAMETSAHA